MPLHSRTLESCKLAHRLWVLCLTSGVYRNRTVNAAMEPARAANISAVDGSACSAHCYMIQWVMSLLDNLVGLLGLIVMQGVFNAISRRGRAELR